MALARGRAILADNAVLMGNAFLKPPTNSLPSRLMFRKIHAASLDSPRNPLLGRTVTSFCNTSHFTKLADIALSNARSYSSQAVILTENVDLSRVKFAPPKKNARGGQFVTISYIYERKPLRIQTPPLRLPFGVSRPDDSLINSNTWSLQVSFDEMDSNPEIKQFFEFVKRFDELTLNTALAEAKQWFPGKSVASEIIKNNFRQNIKPPKDAKYSPIMKFKIPVSGTEPRVEVFLETEKVPVDAITRNCRVISIIEPRSVWFISGQFGVSWAVLQTKIVENPETHLDTYAFIDSQRPKSAYQTQQYAAKSSSFAKKAPVQAVQDATEEESLEDDTEASEEGEEGEGDEAVVKTRSRQVPVEPAKYQASMTSAAGHKIPKIGAIKAPLGGQGTVIPSPKSTPTAAASYSQMTQTKQTVQPVKLATPAAKPASQPVKQAAAPPSKQAVPPTTKQPTPPAKQTTPPTKQTVPPAKQASQPVKPASSTVKQAAPPAKQASQPIKPMQAAAMNDSSTFRVLKPPQKPGSPEVSKTTTLKKPAAK